LRRSSRLTVLWLTPKTLAIHSWLVPPLLSAPIWQRSSYVTRRYLLMGDLLQSQKVTPSSPHSFMHGFIESAFSSPGISQDNFQRVLRFINICHRQKDASRSVQVPPSSNDV